MPRAEWRPYVLVDGRRMKRGYTTGMCAAAAAKAATLLLFGGGPLTSVAVTTPTGIALDLPVARQESGDGYALCGVLKDGGDDPDVTHGLVICAVARPSDRPGVVLRGGMGVGVVTKPGLSIPVGDAAINPVPRAVITREVEAVLPPGRGVEVTIEVPEGERVALRTLNPKMGVVGGISILGTSGIVEPMSEEAFKNSLVPQLSVARAKGFDIAVLVPGRKGERAAVDRYGFPPDAVVQMGNFVGFMLNESRRAGMRGVVLMGHHGKLVKVAAGVFHTHSKVADARLETIAAQAALLGAGREAIAAVMAGGSAEETLGVLRAFGLVGVFPLLAERASRRAREYLERCGDGEMAVGTALLSLEGELLGADETATALARELGGRLSTGPPGR